MTILAPRRATLQSLKAQAFKEARKYPLFSLLKDSAFYNFIGISNDGSREEFVDEKRHFDELGLFQPILKLEERKGSQQEKLFNAELSNLIGARVHDFEVMGQEIREYRKDLFLVSSNIGVYTGTKYAYSNPLYGCSGINCLWSCCSRLM